MEQFVVPQFIDVESKIIGPITTKQFIVMVIWGLFLFIAYKLLDIATFILFFLGWTTFMGLIGFFKVNGRPFYIFLLILLQGKKKANYRVWRNTINMDDIKNKQKISAAPPASVAPRQKVLGSRLSELALVVDTGGMYQGDAVYKEEEYKATPKDREMKETKK